MNANTNNNAAASGAQNDDYLDKGVAAAEKKFGGQYGMGDASKMRSTNEKITDGARNLFEKATGKNVPDKFSN